MRGKIIRIVPTGKVMMYLIWLEESGFCGRTYTGSIYRNYENWQNLKIGDWLDGLEWKDENRKIIDGDSAVYQL